MTRVLAEFERDELQELKDALDETYGRRPARVAIQELRRKIHGLLQEAQFAEHQQMIADCFALRHADAMGFRRAG